MLPEVGQKFGPYEILGKLGGGGMGVVFRAWDDRLHREVAIKLLHDEFQAPRMRQRFLLEARAASALNHPHICTIFDMGEQDGEPFLVMEVLGGITLKERITQGACSSEEIVRFGSEIADALSAAHGKGIVHRDVKPANIFLQEKPGGDRQVKVLDFGLAKVSMALRSGRDSRALELTSAGSTVGTLAYMSPEQARGEHLDARSDLFSLGIVMYEMATRRPPFRGATSALAFQALLTEAPDPIRTWNVALPRELERIIMRLLVKDRSERYQTARETEDALRKLAGRGDGDWLRKLPRPDVPLVPSDDPVARKPKRFRGRNGSEQEETTLSTEAARDISSAPEHPDFIRPRRMPTPENRPRNVSVRDSTIAASTEGREQDASSSDFPAADPAVVRSTVAADLVAKTQNLAAQPTSSNTMKAETFTLRGDEPGSISAEGQGMSFVPKEANAVSTALVTESPGRISPGTRVTPDIPVTIGVSQGSLRSADAGILRDPSGSRRRATSARSGSSTAGVVGETLQAHPQVRKTTTKLRTWLTAASVLACLLLGLALFLMRSGSFRQIVISSKDTILLAPIVNRTGDDNLNNVVAQGLEIELAQRSRLHWLGLAALDAGRTQAAAADHVSLETISPRTAAQHLGARAYLYGELSREEMGYSIHLDVIDVASNDRLGSLSETALNTEDLPAAITRLSVALRARLGESSQEEKSQAPTPLALQATSSLAALNLFAQAQAASAHGDISRAAGLYQRSLLQAPDFTLAELQLAEIYAREGAEVAAANSASRALASSSRTGDRIAPLAQISAALLSDQDPARAIVLARQLLMRRPQDELALITMAHVMRSQGHMTEALLTAEQAYKLYPFSADAYSEAAFALIGLDRFKEALVLERKASALGLHCDCDVDVASYLDGRSSATSSATDLQASFNRGLSLDDRGQFAAAAVAWRIGVNQAKGDAETSSAAAGMLAQAAIDRALADRCAEVFPFTREAELLTYGRLAAFHIALAEALCSSPTQKASPEAEEYLVANARLHSTASDLLLPLVHAAQALSARQAMQALAALSKVESERDQFPTAAYLRGLAHDLGTQDNLATADLEQASRRRGYAFLSHSTVAPLATHRLADLLARSGNANAAAKMNLQFKSLWANADPGLVVTSARSRPPTH